MTAYESGKGISMSTSLYLDRAAELDAMVRGSQMALCISAVPEAHFCEGLSASLNGVEVAGITGHSLSDWVAELHEKERVLVGVVSVNNGVPGVSFLIDVSESLARLLAAAVAAHIARRSWAYIASLGLVAPGTVTGESVVQ